MSKYTQTYAAFVFRLPDGHFLRSFRMRTENGSALHITKTKDIYEASHFRMGSDKTELKEMERAYPQAMRLNIQIERRIIIDGRVVQ